MYAWRKYMMRSAYKSLSSTVFGRLKFNQSPKVFFFHALYPLRTWDILKVLKYDLDYCAKHGCTRYRIVGEFFVIFLETLEWRFSFCSWKKSWKQCEFYELGKSVMTYVIHLNVNDKLCNKITNEKPIQNNMFQVFKSVLYFQYWP